MGRCEVIKTQAGSLTRQLCWSIPLHASCDLSLLAAAVLHCRAARCRCVTSHTTSYSGTACTSPSHLPGPASHIPALDQHQQGPYLLLGCHTLSKGRGWRPQREGKALSSRGQEQGRNPHHHQQQQRVLVATVGMQQAWHTTALLISGTQAAALRGRGLRGSSLLQLVRLPHHQVQHYRHHQHQHHRHKQQQLPLGKQLAVPAILAAVLHQIVYLSLLGRPLPVQPPWQPQLQHPQQQGLLITPVQLVQP